MQKDEYYMKIALKLAEKARKNGEIPVGAVIVYNNKIIGKGYNKKEKKQNSILHAEIMAIFQASHKLKNWRLNECTLYVTMEPCMMCCGAIEQSRIYKVVYGTENKKFGYSINLRNIQLKSGVCELDCKNILQTFFKNIR